MESVMTMGSFCEMNLDEMLMVDGGVDVGAVVTGLSILGGFCVAVACAPATAFVGAAYGVMLVGAALTGSAAGLSIGYGLVS